MRWWTLAIYASVAWALLVAAVAVALMWNIAAHPLGEKADDARAGSVGVVTGMLLVVGLVPIWALLFVREQKRSASRSSRQPPSLETDGARQRTGEVVAGLLPEESEIVIRRGTGYADSLRAYTVKLDDIVVATLRAGGRASVTIEPGRHTLQIWIDWCSSGALEFDAQPGGRTGFECGDNLAGWRIFLASVYVLFLRDQYLWLRQLDAPETAPTPPPRRTYSDNPYQPPTSES